MTDECLLALITIYHNNIFHFVLNKETKPAGQHSHRNICLQSIFISYI